MSWGISWVVKVSLTFGHQTLFIFRERLWLVISIGQTFVCTQRQPEWIMLWPRLLSAWDTRTGSRQNTETIHTCYLYILFFTATHLCWDSQKSQHTKWYSSPELNIQKVLRLVSRHFPLNWERVAVWGKPQFVRLSLFSDTFTLLRFAF